MPSWWGEDTRTGQNGCTGLAGGVERLLAAAVPALDRLPAWVRPRHVHRALCRRILSKWLGAPGVPRERDDPAELALAAFRGLPCGDAVPREEPTAGAVMARYQELLDLAVVHGPEGWTLATRGSDRKAAGSFYTIDGLTVPTVRRTLEPLLARADSCAAVLALRVCDPAMGTGAFLAAAGEILADALEERGVPRHEALEAVSASCLIGMDVDPLAVTLARWSLGAGAHLLHGDALRPGALDRCEPFDAIVGNPPWEVLQPNAREFFSGLLPSFRELGRAEGDRARQMCFAADPGAARDWRRLQERHRAFATWVKGPSSPYRLQGKGKLHSWRLFLERSWNLLENGGRLGMLVPATLYNDSGARALRCSFLDEGQWEWLYSFENREGLFEIDSRYRFGLVIVEKGGHTEAVRVAFGRTDPSDWAKRRPRCLRYGRKLIDRLNPRSTGFVELNDPRDLELLGRMQRRGRPLLEGAGGPFRFAQGDFNMTAHMPRFVSADAAHELGFEPGADDLWQRGEEVLLPLLQGGMIGILDPRAAGHAGGAGHRTRWRPHPRGMPLAPQFLVRSAEFSPWAPGEGPGRLVFRTLSNATNERTCIVAVQQGLPCGNSLGILTPRVGDHDLLTGFAAGVMASLIFDWTLRLRLSGTNLNRYLLEEMVLPETDAETEREVARLAGRLCRGEAPAAGRVTLDGLVARAWGLTVEDLEWMLRGCDHSPVALADRGFTRTLDPKGFWRVGRRLPAQDRLPVQVLAEFSRLASWRPGPPTPPPSRYPTRPSRRPESCG